MRLGRMRRGLVLGWCAAALLCPGAVAAEQPVSSSLALSQNGQRRVAPRRQRLGIDPRPELAPAERAARLSELRALYERDPAEWPAPRLDEGIEHRELGSLPPVSHPEANPDGEAKRHLGEMLFFDPRLSGSGQIACASCHDPDLGWADGRTASFGHNRRRLARNSPSILNAAHRETLFWDGRAATLEEQAKAVLANADEMHSGDAMFIDRLAEIPDYRARFSAVFGVDEPGIDEVAKALACFERSVVSKSTAFDRFVAGRYDALTDEAVSGLHLFRTDARCLNCHNGPNFTDDQFHNLGLTHYGRRFEDLGRYNVTEDAEDVGRFRTPSLRNVSTTTPYMHHGLFDIGELLRLYNAGMPNERRRASQADDPLFPTKSPHVKPLGLNTQDIADLEAFLGSLAEPRRVRRPPELPAGL